MKQFVVHSKMKPILLPLKERVFRKSNKNLPKIIIILGIFNFLPARSMCGFPSRRSRPSEGRRSKQVASGRTGTTANVSR